MKYVSFGFLIYVWSQQPEKSTPANKLFSAIYEVSIYNNPWPLNPEKSLFSSPNTVPGISAHGKTRLGIKRYSDLEMTHEWPGCWLYWAVRSLLVGKRNWKEKTLREAIINPESLTILSGGSRLDPSVGTGLRWSKKQSTEVKYFRNIQINSLVPWRFQRYFQISNFPANFGHWWLRYLFWNYPPMNVTVLYWW